MAKRTIRALYETEAQAAQAREQLAAAGFREVETFAREESDSVEAAHPGRGAAEGGRVVLVAKVDELLQTEAAEIIDATSLGQIAPGA